jgi:hypothetical protein
MYVKAKAIPDGFGGKTNGILMRIGNKDFYVPSTQVKNNALVTAANTQNDIAAIVENLKTKSAKTFNLTGQSFTYVDKEGKAGAIKPNDNIRIVFEEDNRNNPSIYKVSPNGKLIELTEIN